jgi:hypothetical protein
MTQRLLQDIEARARAATWPRCDEWTIISLSPSAIVFHTPEQLLAFVQEEVRRAFTQNQIPAAPTKAMTYATVRVPGKSDIEDNG